MIIALKDGISEEKIQQLSKAANAFVVKYGSKTYLVNGSGHKTVPDAVQDSTDSYLTFSDDCQLSSRKFQNQTREIPFLQGVIGKANTIWMVGGPCSVESEQQIDTVAAYLSKLGISTLRGGCYKPRTSPYSFQGLGKKGLELLAAMREKYNMAVITEVRDATQVREVAEYTDIIQIGAKAMYDYGILEFCGKLNKPVLIKRGFGSTIKELVQMSEYILSAGNPHVMVCERGIRTFETATRFTLDLCGVAYLQEYTNLPVIVDPSHAMGFAYGVPSLAKAALAMGANGLLIETHPEPPKALSDAAQQLDLPTFGAMYADLQKVASALGMEWV